MKKWIAIILYHAGRITVYASLGWLAYGLRALFHPQWQQYVSIAVGITLLVVGILSFLTSSAFRVRLPWLGMVQQRLGKLMANPSISSLLMAGMLNGLLPCGLVYMALSLAATATTPVTAVGIMYAFGIGTMPMLISLSVLGGKVRFLQHIQIRKWVPAFMFLFGSILIVRGMNLGIPYLSPQITTESNAIQVSCCHKPR